LIGAAVAWLIAVTMLFLRLALLDLPDKDVIVVLALGACLSAWWSTCSLAPVVTN